MPNINKSKIIGDTIDHIEFAVFSPLFFIGGLLGQIVADGCDNCNMCWIRSLLLWSYSCNNNNNISDDIKRPKGGKNNNNFDNI